jgi:hypothetical protein
MRMKFTKSTTINDVMLLLAVCSQGIQANQGGCCILTFCDVDMFVSESDFYLMFGERTTCCLPNIG